jgi:hypothetical protein
MLYTLYTLHTLYTLYILSILYIPYMPHLADARRAAWGGVTLWGGGGGGRQEEPLTLAMRAGARISMNNALKTYAGSEASVTSPLRYSVYLLY